MRHKKSLNKAWVFVVCTAVVCGVSSPVSAENKALTSGKTKSGASHVEAAVSQPSPHIQALESGVLGTGYVNSSGWCQPFVDLSAAGSDVSINGFEVYFKGTATRTIQVYYKAGSYSGSETTSGDWSSLGSLEVTPGGDGTLTAVALGGVTIPAGETYGFYFWDGQTGDSDGPGLDLRSGGTSASDGMLSLSSSDYTCDDAFVSLLSGFGWQGNVLYSTGDEYVYVPVPSLNTWGLLGLIALIGLFGFQVRKRHQRGV